MSKQSTFTQRDFANAPIMTSNHYATLTNPIFEGQTKMDADGNYKMYWSCNGELFGYSHNLFN